jgi:4-hydroxy-tetrahydrodipicolinate synthase
LAAISGQKELAKELNSQLENLHKNLFIESNPIPVKWALHKKKKKKKGIRLPLLMLSEELQSVVLNDLEELGVL